MSLFIKECKKIFLSLPYVILVIVLILFAYSQEILSFKNSPIEEPKPGQVDYGMMAREISEGIMPEALSSLYSEFSAGSYITYPLGFYKNVILSDEEQSKVAESLSKLTGIPSESLLESSGTIMNKSQNLHLELDENFKTDKDGNYVLTMPDETDVSAGMDHRVPLLKEGLSYEDFLVIMEEVDEILGGGSSYATTRLIMTHGQTPLNYEEALKEYNIAKEGGFTNTYARVFSDYLGCMMGLLPVFIAVALGMKDRLAKINELIYTRKSSSFATITIRYLAILAMVMLPVIILSVISNLSIWSIHAGETLDYLAGIKYAFGWLLPSVMISSAVGMFLTELTDTPIAIAVQGLWWFIDLNLGTANIVGGFDLFRVAPRHNSFLYSQVFMDNFNSLIVNRLFFAGLSIILLILTICIYEQKRKGSYHAYEHIKALFRNRKGQPAA